MYLDIKSNFHITLLLLAIVCSGCTGLGQHIDGPDEFDRDYYSPEKQRNIPETNSSNLLIHSDINLFHNNQPFDRYSLNELPLSRSSITDSDKKLICETDNRVFNAYPAPPLSPGDRVQIFIHEGAEFSSVYEVNLDGTLGLPLIDPVFVAGKTPVEAEIMLKQSLIKNKIFNPRFLRISLRVQQWAAVQVQVTGAVFNPGMVTINSRKAEERLQQSTQWSGDFTTNRLLSSALQAAGGIRPDANLKKIYLIRNNIESVYDISGVMDGNLIQLPSLAAGDRIYIPSTGVFDTSLVRPSSITPPGVRVFISNLTMPSTNNASSGINRHATSLPYGTRLLSAAISANCVGGSSASNSNRTTVLVSNNPMTGESEIIERTLEKLVTNRKRDTYNPHIMPNDGIACYDSSVTNLREIGRTLTDILFPFALF